MTVDGAAVPVHTWGLRPTPWFREFAAFSLEHGDPDLGGSRIGVRNAASNRAGVVTERRDAPHNQHNTTLYQVSPTVGTNTPGRRAALRLDSRSLPETAIGHGGACGLTAEGEHWAVQAMRLAFARGIPLMASTKCSDVHVTFEPR